MVRPLGRPPKVTTPIKLHLSDSDRRYVDSMVFVMGVTYSEFFSIVLEAARNSADPVDPRTPEGVA